MSSCPLGMVKIHANGNEKLKDKLTYVNKFSNRVFYDYIEDGKYLYVPRTFGKVPENSWDSINITDNIVLRDYQKELSDKYIEHIRKFNGGIIAAKVGTGKTVIAINLIKRIGLKTLIIVHTERILEQWINQIKNICSVDVGIVRGSTYKPADITVGLIHSLSKPGRYPNEFYSSFGFIIYDECHVLGAYTFSRASKLFHCKYVLGLSGTPRRKDNMDKVFINNIGAVIKYESMLMTKPKICLVKYSGSDSSDKGCLNYRTQDLIIGKYISKIARLAKRNAKIANCILISYKKNRRVLVLSDRISQLNMIRKILERDIKPEDIGMFTADIKEPDKKIILSTYGSGGVGLDLSDITVLVIATPRVDIEQSIGRVLRNKNAKPVVFDIVDTESKVMNIWAAIRLRFYKNIDAEVVTFG